MVDPLVRVSVEEGVGVVTIDRPKALNALSREVLEELDAAISKLGGLPELRALIVTGAGEKAFVAGADIAQMASYAPEQARAFAALGHRVFASLEALWVPTIAAVNGFALGGGLELALSCDLIYASERAKLGLPEVSLGVIPGFGGTQRLSRLLGKQRAKELIFTGEMIDAVKAKEVGLVLEVFSPERLLPHCREVARKISQKGPLAVAQAKRVVEHGVDLPLASANELERQAFAALFGSADQKEGMAAFAEKRAAAFIAK